jgi:hypothetical protein
MGTLVAAFPRRRRKGIVARMRARAATVPGLPAPAARAVASAGSVVLLGFEIVVSLAMWLPIPFAWLWIGGRVYDATGSLAADGGVALLGFTASVVFAFKGLLIVDGGWIALRRKAGHEQKEGALTQVVIASATLGLLAFAFWYYVLSDAYIIPFMPSR